MYNLYSEAEKSGVAIIRAKLPLTHSLSLLGVVGLDEELLMDGKQERTSLGHEMGHNARGAFYTIDDPPCIRQRCEVKADKWAIKKLIPKDELKEAIKKGYTEIWQLSDYFTVTEEFVVKALCWYRYGNLALNYYM